MAPYRGDPDADVDKGKGLLLPWYWDMLYARDWGGLFTYDVFSHLWFLWYLVWLAGSFILLVWVAATAGPEAATSAGAAGGYTGALPVGGAADDGDAVLHGC